MCCAARSFASLSICRLVLVLGQGDVGQLGLGEDVMERKRAALLALPEKTIQVEAERMHTVCLSQSGKVYIFGCNDKGALGRDTSAECSEMVPGKVELEKRIVQVSAGDSHTVALSENGVVYIWGSFMDNNGVIGLLEVWAKCTAPKQLHTAEPILSIKSGNDHLVLLSLGGTPDTSSVFMPTVMTAFRKSSVTWTGFSGGQHHALCLDSDGQVYSLGRAEYGRLGLGEGGVEKSEPTAVPELTDAEMVACGSSVSFAVTRSGDGDEPAAGDGGEEDEWRPVEMTGKQLENHAVLSVSIGGQHTVLLVKDL
ncbi:Regulator of chromosome condensation [Acipenser ruthenus]|uniref:Regulator of chromosome condensation n=1 Tax=Acipenser ruthenus TaxID=7906 RepID=A0A444ULR7_ACIRT|nr:Regulator of chromosome condensation [Acipenser ruthenus]